MFHPKCLFIQFDSKRAGFLVCIIFHQEFDVHLGFLCLFWVMVNLCYIIHLLFLQFDEIKSFSDDNENQSVMIEIMSFLLFQSFVVSLFSMTIAKSAAPLRRHFWSSSNSEFSFLTSSSVLSSSSLKLLLRGSFGGEDKLQAG